MGLERDLRGEVRGEVRFEPGSMGLYVTDASNYRQVPIGVVVQRRGGAHGGSLSGEHGDGQARGELLACAERVLLPAVRAADPAALILADGFSCRSGTCSAVTGGGRHAPHLPASRSDETNR